MRTLEQRDARAITLGDRFFFLLAHLMWIVKLLEELVRVLDSIDAKIEMVDVLIAGPEPRGLIRRIGAVRRQRKVWLGAGDGWRLWLGCGSNAGRRCPRT